MSFGSCSLFILGLSYAMAHKSSDKDSSERSSEWYRLPIDKNLSEMSKEEHKYMIMEIKDGKLMADYAAGQEITSMENYKDEFEFKKMIQHLPSDNSRYVLYQFSFPNIAGKMPIKQRVIVSWYIMHHRNFKSILFIHALISPTGCQNLLKHMKSMVMKISKNRWLTTLMRMF